MTCPPRSGRCVEGSAEPSTTLVWYMTPLFATRVVRVNDRANGGQPGPLKARLMTHADV